MAKGNDQTIADYDQCLSVIADYRLIFERYAYRLTEFLDIVTPIRDATGYRIIVYGRVGA